MDCAIFIVHNFCNGDVRLVGGNSVSEGRVEICYNGVWGSICYYGWTNIDAAIVCRQLGFQKESKQTIMYCIITVYNHKNHKVLFVNTVLEIQMYYRVYICLLQWQ